MQVWRMARSMRGGEAGGRMSRLVKTSFVAVIGMLLGGCPVACDPACRVRDRPLTPQDEVAGNQVGSVLDRLAEIGPVTLTGEDGEEAGTLAIAPMGDAVEL